MLITLKRGLFLVCSCLGNLHTVEPQLLNYLLQGGDARRTWEMLITQTNLKWLLMFPVTKQSQLITKPLFQALTATGRIGPATIHTGELTSAHFRLQKPKEGGAAMLVHRAMDAVSTTLLGKNAQGCTAAGAVCSPHLLFAEPLLSFLLQTELSLCQQGALLPLNKMFCKHTRQRLCKAFCLSLAVGETESRASSMLDKSPAAESQSLSYLCFLWIPSWVGCLANSFNTLWASPF